MKKVMMIAALMVATLSANAQQSVGTWSITPKVGVNLATITDADDASMKIGLVAGADVTYQLAEPFAISFGAFYSMQGAKDDETISGVKVDETMSLDYINIPIMANYYVIPGLAIKAGIQPAFNVKHEVKAEANGSSYSSDIDHFNSLDISIPLGASYEFGDFVIDARYNLGLTKLIDISGYNSKNSVFQFTLGYKIPF